MSEGRPSAYADLLAALLAVRTDPATARFDAELYAAEARGEIDGATARTLRWWQRESLRGLADHLGHVLPHLLDDLSTASLEAAESVQDSASSWSAASGGSDGAAGSPGPASSERAVGAVERATEPPEPGNGSHLRPVEDLAGPGPADPAGAPGDRQDPDPQAPLPPAPRLLRPGFAPPPDDPSAGRTPTPGAPRPRLLVSGVTVRSEDLLRTPVVDLTDRPATADTRPDGAPLHRPGGPA